MPTTTRTRAALAATAVALLAAGCGGSGSAEEGGPSADDAAAWARSTDPVAAGGLVWATDDVVHLSDGTTVDVGQPMTTYVVAGDGVYFTPADDGDTRHGNMTTGPLRFADRDGEVVDTGLTVYVESLGASPDGRYLGLVDATSGPRDGFSDHPQAIAVVLDLTTGDRVVDTTDGMGDPDEDDLAHDYPETDLSVRFPGSGSAFVEGLDEDVLYALPSGEGDAVDALDAGVRSPLDRRSPDGRWAIDDRGRVEVLLSADGGPVRPRTGTATWDLAWWLDDDTVLGFAAPGPGGPSTLITCEVPDGACDTVPGTAGALVRFPVDTAPNDSVDLGGGQP